MSSTPPSSAKRALILSVLVTLLLYMIPFGGFIAYPLILLSTLAHELGHGLTAILVGAEFRSFVLHADGSGVAMTAGVHARWQQALISAGGLVGPAVVSAVLLGLGKKPKAARWSLRLIGFACIAALLLVVRNLFGWLFIGLFAMTCLIIAGRAVAKVSQFALVFIAVQLALSVFSRSDYLFTKTAMTAQGPMPSDVAHMAQALFLPYWFWGGVCGGFSLLVVFLGIRTFLSD